MFNIEAYIDKLKHALNINFGKRLLYVGLQGSYLRNEATEKSDIDIMVVIDALSPEDLGCYRKVLITVGDFEKSCGFICGRQEMMNWNPLEICHLLHTTKDYYGRLKDFLPAYTLEDERNYIKLSLDNLFHELCHRYVHSEREDNIKKLPLICKSVFFILQNMHYLQNGYFAVTKQDLIERVRGEDKHVLELTVLLNENKDYDFDQAFSTLFKWCQNALSTI